MVYNVVRTLDELILHTFNWIGVLVHATTVERLDEEDCTTSVAKSVILLKLCSVQ